ncbi:hypothetical protein QL093DRAFT_2568346 [Fusarium oxysporum]|nr:hypothetical protein QL093DRAFT_2568346 [Fusarium oxysporum]
MTSIIDWGINTQDEPDYGLSWGDMPEGLHPWDWDISSNTLYNICAMPGTLIPPSSSEHCESDAITGSMLNDEGLYSAPLSGSLSSTHSVEEYFQPESRIQQACLYEEATLGILQDHRGSLSTATDSIPNSTPPEVSASIKTRTTPVTKAEGRKRNRRKPSDKKNARRTKTEINREEKKRYMKVLERNRRAAANCRARKQEQQDKLNAELEKLQDRHKELFASCNELRETAYQLKLQLLRHGDCGCALIQRFIANEAVNSVETLISKQSPSSSPNCTTASTTARWNNSFYRHRRALSLFLPFKTSPSLDAQIIMSTAAIIPDFNGFEWDGPSFSSKSHLSVWPRHWCSHNTLPPLMAIQADTSHSTFDSILSQFEQDPVFLDPLYQTPGYYLRPMSPIPNILLTQIPNPSSSELHKTGKASSCITNSCIGKDDLPAQGGEVPQSKHSNKNLDSSWADMNQAKALPPALTAGLLERRDSTMSNEESLVGLEKTPTQVKMRSASRRPKKVGKKPALPAHVVQARQCHNDVEKQYRTRLKQKFERLLAVLQASKVKDESGGEGDSEAPDCGYSRGEVLDFARQRILALEEENRRLSDQVQHLDRRFTIFTSAGNKVMNTYRARIMFRKVPRCDTIRVKDMLTIQLAKHVRVLDLTQTDCTRPRAGDYPRGVSMAHDVRPHVFAGFWRSKGVESTGGKTYLGNPTKNIIVKAIIGSRMADNHASIPSLGAEFSGLPTSVVIGLDMTATA